MKTRIICVLFVFLICFCSVLVSCGKKAGNENEVYTVKESHENSVEWTVTKMGSVTCSEVSAGNSMDNSIVYELGGKYGLMDNNGNVRIKPKYDKIVVLSENFCFAKIDEAQGLITTNDEIAIPFSEDISSFEFDGKYIMVFYNNLVYNGKMELFDIDLKKVVNSIDVQGKGGLDHFQEISFRVYDDVIYCFITNNFYDVDSKPIKLIETTYDFKIYDKNCNKIYEVENYDSFDVAEPNGSPVVWKKDGIIYLEIDGEIYDEEAFEIKNNINNYVHDSIFNTDYRIYRYYI